MSQKNNCIPSENKISPWRNCEFILSRHILKKIIKMDKCRLCGEEKYLENLCNFRDPEWMIEIKLETVFNIKLTNEKLMPQCCCFECISKLDCSLEFFKRIKETQQSLLENLNNQLLQCENSFEVKEEIKIEVIDTELVAPPLLYPELEVYSSNHLKIKKRRKKLQSSSENYTNDRCKGTRVEDIFKNEINGIYESQPETLDLLESEKNDDGTITESGLLRIPLLGWSAYIWRCVVCKVSIDSSKSLEAHFKIEHTKTKPIYPCMDCKLSFKSYFSFQNHVIDNHKPNLKFSCDVCSEFRWNLMSLYNHRRHLHPKYKNTCLYCGRLFESGFSLKQHVSVHMKFKEDELFFCDICGFQAHTKFLIKQHIHVFHLKINTEWVCEQCGKICKRLSDMRSHQLVHTSERPYGCNHCELRFKCKKQLRCHERTHFARILKEECSVCLKRFLTKSKLTRHFKVHTDDYEYTCEFCGRKFKHASGFNTHRRIHTGERPYVCSFPGCEQKFIDWPNMNKHMKNKHAMDNSSRKKKVYMNQPPPEHLL